MTTSTATAIATATCVNCKQPLERKGIAWVDPTGGDVCGHDGGNESHAAEESISSQLAQFTGSENQYRHAFMRSFRYTDGIIALAELSKAYWLIDLTASHQVKAKVRREPFQLWSIRKLPAGSKNAAVAECRTDSNGRLLCRQFIPYTDFPFGDLGTTYEWYVCDHVMLLKSEY